MVVVLFRVLVINDVLEDLHQPLGQLLVLVRIADDDGVNHAQTSEHNRWICTIKRFHGGSFDIWQMFPEVLMDVEQGKVALATDDRSAMFCEFLENRDYVCDEGV